MTVCGLFEREEYPDDLWLSHESEIQIWKSSFWYRGYFVDTVGRNKKVIADYIRNQLLEDFPEDRLFQLELFDPLHTGEDRRKK